MAPPTIISHKLAFITNQTIQLSQSLEPSAVWRAANERATQGSLPARAVDDALFRLNQNLTQHARRVYAPQATRHIAEQIDGLFRAETGDEDDDADQDGGGLGERRESLRVGADYVTEEVISALPQTWDSHNEGESAGSPLEARRYAELVVRLDALSVQRREARERVERLQRMAEVLKPFGPSPLSNDKDTMETDGAEPGENQNRMQQNLITRNGEVERELERMRVLLARVTGRLATLPDKRSAQAGAAEEKNDAMDLDLDHAEREKVDRLLEEL